MRLPNPWATPLLTIEAAGAWLHMSKAAAYRAVRRGELPTVRIAGGRRVPTADLYRLAGLPLPAPPTAPRIVSGPSRPQ